MPHCCSITPGFLVSSILEHSDTNAETAVRITLGDRLVSSRDDLSSSSISLLCVAVRISATPRTTKRKCCAIKRFLPFVRLCLPVDQTPVRMVVPSPPGLRYTLTLVTEKNPDIEISSSPLQVQSPWWKGKSCFHTGDHLGSRSTMWKRKKKELQAET